MRAIARWYWCLFREREFRRELSATNVDYSLFRSATARSTDPAERGARPHQMRAASAEYRGQPATKGAVAGAKERPPDSVRCEEVLHRGDRRRGRFLHQPVAGVRHDELLHVRARVARAARPGSADGR